MALRRWKPFLGAFEHADAVIEAAGSPDCVSRDEFRRARGEIVEILCGAADDRVAEAICLLLDDAMAEALLTLREAVPASAVKVLLASGELVASLGALIRGHGSERVRGLARDVVHGWRAGVVEELAMATAAMGVLNGLSHSRLAGRSDNVDKKKQADVMPEKQARPEKMPAAPVVGCGAAKTVKVSDPSPKQRAPAIVRGHVKAQRSMEASTEVRVPPPPKKTSPEDTKMEATKRKLHVRYQEAEDAKRRRTIRVIQAPIRKQSKAHPAAVRARGRASCAAERRGSLHLPRFAGCS